MRSLAIVTALCAALFTLAFAQDTEEAMEMKGTAKITVPPAMKHIDASTAVTAFVKAADLAPEEGWGDKDYDKVFPAMVGKGMEMCMKWMQKTGGHPMGPGFSIYYESPENTKAGDLTSKHGFPITGDYDPIEGVVIEEMPAAEVAAITYTGDYSESGNAWNDLMKFIETEGYEWAGPPMEVYLVSQNDTDNPDEWITEIRWPVMKKEMKEEGSEDGEGTEKSEEAEAEGEE